LTARTNLPVVPVPDEPPQTYGRPVYHSGDAIKRAAMALRENWRSGDTILLAKIALEAAYRTDRDLLLACPAAKMPAPKTAKSAEPAPLHA
jgi:hypothetical protein